MKTKARQITIAELFAALRIFWPLVIAAALLFGAVGYLYTVRRTVVTYTAVSGVYVHAADVDMESGSTSSQITLARAHALECKDAVKAEALYTNIKAYFADRRDEGWEDLSVWSNEQLRAMFTCNVENSSQYVEISVTAPSASLAVHLANAAAGVFEVSVIDVISNCRIEPMLVARTAAAQSSFSYATAMLAAFVGAVLSYAVLFLLYFLCPYVRSEQELVDAYGEAMPLLGSIPKRENRRRGPM